MSRNFLTCSFFFCAFLSLSACSTDLPEEKHDRYAFPVDSAYVNLPTGKNETRPYETMGWVRTKVVFQTMNQEPNNPTLCRNYYNKGVRTLLADAKKAGADAVVQIRSVIIFMDGKTEEKETPECSDDGAEGEILLRGVAIKYKKTLKKAE